MILLSKLSVNLKFLSRESETVNVLSSRPDWSAMLISLLVSTPCNTDIGLFSGEYPQYWTLSQSVSQSVSQTVSQWQGHLLSCPGQLKTWIGNCLSKFNISYRFTFNGEILFCCFGFYRYHNIWMFRKLVAPLGNEVNYGASFDVVVLFTKTTMENDQWQLEIVNFHWY